MLLKPVSLYCLIGLDANANPASAPPFAPSGNAQPARYNGVGNRPHIRVGQLLREPEAPLVLFVLLVLLARVSRPVLGRRSLLCNPHRNIGASRSDPCNTKADR